MTKDDDRGQPKESGFGGLSNSRLNKATRFIAAVLWSGDSVPCFEQPLGGDTSKQRENRVERLICYNWLAAHAEARRMSPVAHEQNYRRRNAMKTICTIRSFACAGIAFGALWLATSADAADSDFKVIAHLPLSGGARQMFLQQEGKTQYLYAQRLSPQGVTVIDVTNPERPKVVNHVPLENLTMLGSGLAISETLNNSPTVGASSGTGNAEDPTGSDAARESVRMLDVSDPVHPRMVETFEGVTSILQDSARNLVYVANGDGVWIVSHQQTLRRHDCSSSDAVLAMPNCD